MYPGRLPDKDAEWPDLMGAPICQAIGELNDLPSRFEFIILLNYE